MIGIARPTRGLEYAESADSLEKNLRGIPHIIERTWDEPIPESFNHLVEKLLEYPDVADIIFVEEDVVVPSGAIIALLAAPEDVVAVSYLLKSAKPVLSEQRDLKGNLLWVSMGLTRIRRKVFETLAKPWFMAGWAMGCCHDGSSTSEKYYKLVRAISVDYGGQDVFMCWNAQQAGFTLKSLPYLMADHLQLMEMGKPGTNQGCHVIQKVSLE